ncbi:hypothetical protein [Crocosphaera subtropica]|nr:hypothetical protein [Crocosphaera subtropica]
MITRRINLDVASVEHPLINRMFGEDLIIDFDSSYHPIPEWRNIPVGYDMIIQFRDDLLSRYLRRNISLGRGEYFVDYSPESLEPSTINVINDLTPQGETTPVFIQGTGIYFHEIAFEPYQIKFQLQQGTVKPNLGTEGQVVVEWDLNSLIVFRETSDSLEFRRRQEDTRITIEPITQEIKFATNSLRVTAELTLESEIEKYHVWGSLDFRDSTFSLEQDEPLAQTYFGFLIDTLNAALSSKIVVTPQVVIPGYYAGRQVNVDLGRMFSYRVVTKGNQPRDKILHICLSFDREVDVTNLDLVRPFSGEDNYAIYQHENLVLKILRAKWNLLFERDREILIDTELPLIRERREVSGRGRFRLKFQQLRQADFATTLRRPDFIRVLIIAENELLQAWDEFDRELDVNDLGVVPKGEEALGIMYFPFRQPITDPTNINRFINRLFTNLLRQMYTPFHGRDISRLSRINGYLSKPLQAIFITGNL